MTNHPIRVLLAKIGLDGHDRGVKILARSFRDAGFDVIYTGLWQTSQATMLSALQEDIDVVGVSLLSAAHMTVMPELLRHRKELGIEQVPVVLGGIVPEDEHQPLLDMGCAAVFNPGSPLDKIVEMFKTLAAGRQRMSVQEAMTGYAEKSDTALAQLITHIQRDQVNGKWQPEKGTAKVIGITGSPGVGKSSVIGKLGKTLCGRGYKVAVVAVDPTSPVNGGALLGDRLRMMWGEPGDRFFIRSLSSGKVYGGLGPHVEDVIKAFDGYGFDYVLVESVGAGQSDTAIRDVVDKTILLLMPESGDAIQFSKAGIMEIANSFVLNKCDLPGADATEGQLISALGKDRPVYRVSTVKNEGIDAVADWVVSL
jgi:LAO/AO transport system ATPase